VVLQQAACLSDETHLRVRKFVAAAYSHVCLDRSGRGVSAGESATPVLAWQIHAS
jgi:hypothetical protein